MGKKGISIVIGSVVVAANTGLGILAKSFYDNGLVNKVLLYNHPKYGTIKDWYKEEDTYQNIESFLNNIDTLFLFEVCNLVEPRDWSLAALAKVKGIKVILMPMYESTPYPLPKEVAPDKWIYPSKLDELVYTEQGEVGEFIPVPVKVKKRLRKKARTFVHNAGSANSQYLDRNGTSLLLKALPYVKSPIKLIFRSRDTSWQIDDERVEFRLGDADYDTLWDEGDVFVFPEAYNGLCLPLQEAFAAGMLVIAGDRFPINTWLPQEPLLPISNCDKIRNDWQEIPISSYNSIELASLIDSWYDEDIQTLSTKGIKWAEENSWDKLKPVYERVLNEYKKY
jgi:hypothetical protein